MIDNESYNGRVCTVEQNDCSCSGQMITFTKKLLNLNYELPMAYLNRNIRIFRYLQCN